MENLTGGNPPVRPLPCVVPCKLYFVHIQINTYDKQPNLKIIARHLRNSVAHARLELKAQEQPEFDKPLLIESVIFRDEDGEKSFQIELPIETLEQFFYAFSDAAASL